MKVVLQKNVDKFGKAGDVLEAAPGYFRNFLQPRNLAVVATSGALKKREEDLAGLRKKADETHQAAVELAEKISGLETIKIQAKAGDGGRLYGKVTNKEIALELNNLLGQEIDKRLVKPSEDITSLGTFKVIVKVAAEVQSEIMVEVISQD